MPMGLHDNGLQQQQHSSTSGTQRHQRDWTDTYAGVN
jgi:hypothetical protein